eukprot:Rhum_TRINITY_DN25316_c0_g1::Rhum_TRINITY_DN25316_c0_g1_i1::g.181805::m.181805
MLRRSILALKEASASGKPPIGKPSIRRPSPATAGGKPQVKTGKPAIKQHRPDAKELRQAEKAAAVEEQLRQGRVPELIERQKLTPAQVGQLMLAGFDALQHKKRYLTPYQLLGRRFVLQLFFRLLAVVFLMETYLGVSGLVNEHNSGKFALDQPFRE